MKLAIAAPFLCFFLFGLGQARAQSLCVTKSGTVLRSAPSSGAAMSWKVPRYMPLQPTGVTKGSWNEVSDVDGAKHWVHDRDVSSKINCMVVKSRKTRLRTGPGSQYETAPGGVADRYSSFIDKGGEDGWAQVEDEMGQKGWINLDQVWKPHRKLRMSFDSK